MSTLEELRKKYKASTVDDNYRGQTSLEDLRKKYKSTDNPEYDTDEVNDWFDKAKWVVSRVSEGSQKPNYDFVSRQSGVFSKQVDDLISRSDYISEYVESQKGSQNYNSISKRFEDYLNSLNDMSGYTKSMSAHASNFKTEDEYNNAVKEVKFSSKYKDLKTNDDYDNAIANVQNGSKSGADYQEEVNWLKKHKEDTRTLEDLEDEYKRISNEFETFKSNRDYNPFSSEGFANIMDLGAGSDSKDSEYNDKLNDLSSKINQKKFEKYYYNLSDEQRKTIENYLKPEEISSKADDGTQKDTFTIGEEIKSQNESNANKLKRVADELGISTDEFLKYYSRAKAQEQAAAENEAIKQYAQDNPVTESIRSVLQMPFDAISTTSDYLASGLDKATGGEGYLDPTGTAMYKNQKTREGVNELIDNPVGSFLYNTGMSVADFALLTPLSAVPGGTAVSLGIMSTEAGTNAANDALENGSSLEQALATGLASGIAEAFFEKFSIDQLQAFKQSGRSNVKNMVKNVLKGVVTEGSEEVSTDIANYITDNIINGDMSQFNKKRKEYLAQGYSTDEANRAAWGDFGMQLVESFAGGAIAGGVMNVATSGMNYASNAKAGKQIKNNGADADLVEITKGYDDYIQRYTDLKESETTAAKEALSESNKELLSDMQYAQKIAAKVSDGSASNAQIGDLRNNVQSISARLQSKASESALNKYIVSSSLDSSDKKIAKKFITGETLTASEVDRVNSSKELRSVVSAMPEVDNSNLINYIKAAAATDVKIPKPKVKTLKKINTSGMSATNALNAYADELNMDSNTRKAFSDNYDGNMDIDKYAQEFTQFNNLGRLLAPMNVTDSNAYTIPDSVRTAAYEAGVKEYTENAKLRNALTKAQEEWKNNAGGYVKGTVDDTAIKGIELTPDQRDNVKYASKFANLGLNIKFTASKANENGVYTAPNGFYDSSTNTITLDVNSGKKTVQSELIKGAVLNTLSHELTHVSENSTKEYAELRKAVSEAIGGKMWNEYVNRQKKGFSENHPDRANSMTEQELNEYASKEALAQACSEMLTESDILEKTLEENPSLIHKIADFVKKVISRLRELHKQIISDYKVNTPEATDLKNAADNLQAIVDKWEAAVKEGIRNQNARQTVKGNNKSSGEAQEQNRYAKQDGVFKKALTDSDNAGQVSQNQSDRGRASEKAERNTGGEIEFQDRQIYSENFKKWFGDWENDPENASKVLDEDGKPLVVYHGTDSDFTVFDKDKGRSGADIQGMFFSPWDIEASGYGSNIRAFYLNIKNPAPESLAYKILRKYSKENYAGKKTREELIRLGYDGVQNYDEYIAFYPEQIKSADPVTYDNNGKIIPVSQRFNSDEPDIRYQDRTLFSSDDDLLLNASADDDFNVFDLDFDNSYDIDSEKNKIDYDKIVEDYPAQAMEMVITSAAKTANEAINVDVELDDKAYNLISNKVGKSYDIISDSRYLISEALKDFVNSIGNGTNLAESFGDYVSEMKSILYFSDSGNAAAEEDLANVRSVLKNTVLEIDDDILPDIISHYDTYANFARTMRKYGLRVRKASNSIGKNGATIDDVIADVNYALGNDTHFSGVSKMSESADGADAVFELDEYLSRISDSGEYSNVFLSGQAENIDLAAVEFAFDALTEYIDRQTRASVTGNNRAAIRKLKDLRTKFSEERSALTKAKNETKRLQDNLDRVQNAIADVNEDNERLSKLNNRINSTSGEILEKLNAQKAELEEKLARDELFLRRTKAAKGIAQLLDAEKRKAAKRERSKWSDRLKLKNERLEAAEKELNQVRRSSDYMAVERYKEGKKISEIVDGIRKLQNKMTKALLRPTDNVYVPTELVQSYIEVCKSITSALNYNNGTKVSNKLTTLSAELDRINRKAGDYKGEFSEGLLKRLELLTIALNTRLESIPDGKIRKREITLSQAQDIHSVLYEIYNSIQDATRQLNREEGYTNYRSGDKIRVEMSKLKGYSQKVKGTGIKREFLNAIRLARYYTGYDENSELMYHVNELNKGNRVKEQYVMEAEKLFKEFTDSRKSEYDKSLSEIVNVEYTDNSGEKQSIKLTRMMGLQILMSWAREMKNPKLQHMQKGGIDIPNAELFVKGKFKDSYSYDNLTRIRGISLSLISSIERSMTDFEQEYRKIAENYFNDFSKRRINEVSNITKHRSIATSDYYIPFTVNSDFVVKELDNLKFDLTLEGMGMLKSIETGAGEPLEIGGLNRVISRHIEDTGRYYGLAVPVRNFKKALNVQFSEADKETNARVPIGSVRDSINAIWGEKGTKFFNTVISDLEAPRNSSLDQSSNAGKVVKNLRSAMVVKTLTGNLSVVIKQAASYPTAGVYLNSISLTRGLASIKNIIGKGKYQALFDEIDAHTAQHYIRRKGMSSQEIADFARSWSSKHIPTAINPGKWIQGVDVFTTALLWNAVKAEISSKGMNEGAPRYWKEVTELYDKVIEDTQPMYDSLHRAEMQKTSNELVKSVFMFKTQPLQNTGILYDSIGYALQHKNDNQARRTVTKALASQLASLGTFALMSFLASLALFKRNRYKDENDEVTITSAAGTILRDMFVNGVGLAVPIFGTEITDALTNVMTGNSFFDTFSVPVVDMCNDTVEAVASSWKAFSEMNEKWQYGEFNSEKYFNEMLNLGTQVAGFWGVPVSNIRNIVTGFWNNASSIAGERSSFFESQGNRKPQEYARSYGNYYRSGDNEKAIKQLDTLYQEKYDERIRKGDSESNATKKARTAVRNSLSDAYKLEYQKAFLRNDKDKYVEIGLMLNKSGYMKYDNKSFSNVLQKWRENAKDDVQKSFD